MKIDGCTHGQNSHQLNMSGLAEQVLVLSYQVPVL